MYAAPFGAAFLVPGNSAAIELRLRRTLVRFVILFSITNHRERRRQKNAGQYILLKFLFPYSLQ
jgi:hypothetical protein